MAAGASSGKAVFAEVSEPSLYLSVAALWHIWDDDFPPATKEAFYRRMFVTLFCFAYLKEKVCTQFP